jgi:hypothetical protein
MKNLETIQQLLLEKSSTKQKAYRETREVFKQLKIAAQQLAKELNEKVVTVDPSVEVKFYEKSEFEFHLKFSGDTLVWMMHTNVFDFDNSHFIHQSPYIKENPMAVYCGMIQVYNFLADSLKYNREGDLGYLVGRMFVNMDGKFMMEGKRPLSLLYANIAENTVEAATLRNILTESMHYCLNFDLQAPPLEALNYISVEQKNMMSYSTGMPTGKMLGFRNQEDQSPLE